MAKPGIVIQDYAGVAVVTFTDSSLLDAATISKLGDALYELVDKQNKQKLILDFSSVRFLSSQTLGVLLTLSKKCHAIKGRMVLCGLRDELKKIFTLTRLDKMFTFHKNDADALREFDVRLR